MADGFFLQKIQRVVVDKAAVGAQAADVHVAGYMYGRSLKWRFPMVGNLRGGIFQSLENVLPPLRNRPWVPNWIPASRVDGSEHGASRVAVLGGAVLPFEDR